MLGLTLTAALALAPPTGFTASVERVPVSRAAREAKVSTEPLRGQVVLEGLTLKGKPPASCPVVERKGGRLTLRCANRRLWAELSEDAQGLFVDLRFLNGASWQGEGSLLPLRAWPLTAIPLPDTCPGTLPAARGECALARGELEEARAAWTECLRGPDASICHLRLGELALQAGDPEAALAHYQAVTPSSRAGRVGQVRQCELLGLCLDEASSLKLASVESLPASVAREVRLATVRRELVGGREASAMRQLVESLETDPDTCQGALTFCQTVIGVGLESTDSEARTLALSAFLTDKARQGPAEYALNEAASRAAEELGAPAFAAAILSANTPQVPRAELGAHLLRVVRLYLAAHDAVRAGVVLEYAESTLGPLTRSGGWREARRHLTPRTNPAAPPRPRPAVRSVEALSDAVSLSTELARAAAVRSQALTPSPAGATTP